MKIHTTANLHRDFTFVGDDYRLAYAETDDPRILALVERDEYPEAPDGDVYAPTYSASPSYSRGGGSSTFQFGYSAPDAETILDAFMRADEQLTGGSVWTSATVDRYLRIFHGAAVRVMSTSRYRNDEPIVVLDTPEWREHVGIVGGPDKANLTGTYESAEAWLDGDVYGIGYAVNPDRTTFETPVEDCFDTFEQTIVCWGFYGDDFAATCALAFEAGRPDLPPMLPTPEPEGAVA